jgi:hypothetical protein
MENILTGLLLVLLLLLASSMYMLIIKVINHVSYYPDLCLGRYHVRIISLPERERVQKEENPKVVVVVLSG